MIVAEMYTVKRRKLYLAFIDQGEAFIRLECIVGVATYIKCWRKFAGCNEIFLQK